MASEVDICNAALGFIGDAATVASIDPPEGSAQAKHCARFYPLARDALLEMHPWSFATKRVALSALTDTPTEWDYAYAYPADVNNIIAVLPSDATDDYSIGNVPGDINSGVPDSAGGYYVPQPFSAEVTQDGQQVIYSDQQDAVLRYTAMVTDTSQFSPLFTIALSYLLASYLAGPVLKGDTGRQVASAMLAEAVRVVSQAKVSDTGQRRTTVQHNVSWMINR